MANFQIGKRRLQYLGGSLYANMPSEWVAHHGLKPRDSIAVSVDEQHRLVIEVVQEASNGA